MRARAGLLAVVLLMVAGLLTPTFPAFAKGPVDKMTLTGAGLASPIAITDSESLAPFDPWTRGFVSWNRGRVTERPSAEQTYAVSFYLQAKDRPNCAKLDGEFCVIFVMQYSPDPSGGSGYLYIPGPGEPSYRLNKGTIITSSLDAWDPNGKWQYATADWDALMQRVLGEDGVVTPVAASPGTTATPTAKAWVLALWAMGLLGSAAGLLWLRLRQKPS